MYKRSKFYSISPINAFSYKFARIYFFFELYFFDDILYSNNMLLLLQEGMTYLYCQIHRNKKVEIKIYGILALIPFFCYENRKLL